MTGIKIKDSDKNLEQKKLELIEPEFSSNLTDLIIDLNHLRKKELYGSTEPHIFFQLKRLFHLFESIGSARIEGNNTTIAEVVENKISGSRPTTPQLKEINNIEDTMQFIEDTVKNVEIDRAFISEIHKRVVKDLPHHNHGEGDPTPGVYRTTNVKIKNSNHVPPDSLQVDPYMEELFNFINKRDNPKYDLLKAAIAHHRFVWIHPFRNGNGRTVRLLTYAMLVKLGFNVGVGRILNPTAVFCSNRDLYYDRLGAADSGSKHEILNWCEYVLQGLKEEIEKIDKLLDYNYLSRTILMPSLNFSLESKLITPIEYKILRKVIHSSDQVIQAADLKDIFPAKQHTEISRQINRLIKKRMLDRMSKGGRKYTICFTNSYLLRGIIKALEENNFITLRDSEIG